MLSIDSQGSQPRTPRTGRSPNPSQVFFTPSRKSTDSWNSSNADEAEWEWKPDQLLLLSRTLDALPAHLVTPFNGPIPPPNLLDKIARGVSTAKGPEDWPHSLRATRVKLIELARSKANKDDHHCQVSISEEPEFDDASSYSYIHDGQERPLARRKPERQSSMDFIDTAGKDIKNNPDIARLSRRLQRSERASHVPAFHPYSRTTTRRSASPPPPAAVPSLISDSSETLSSTVSSSAAQPRVLRHSISSMSSISMSSATSTSGHPLPDPRVQRIRRSESVSLAAAPRLASVVTSPKPAVGVKRAPSYGALLQSVKREQEAAPADGRHERRDSGSYPSSDEEEKARTRNAKKARVKSTSKTTTSSPKNRAASPPPPPVPEKDDKPAEPELDIAQLLASPPPSSFNKKKMAKVEGTSKKVAPKRPAPMNLQRNPSMFGPELPLIEPTSPPPVPAKSMVAGTRTPPRSPIVAKPRARTHSIYAASSTAAAAASLRAARSPSPTLPLSPSPLSPASALACALSPTAHLVAPDTPASPSIVMSPPGGSRMKKTLKRVRRLVPGRRISFGSMRAVSEDAEGADEEGVEKTCLGSAFQLL